METADMKQAVERYIHAHSNKDLEGVVALFAEHAQVWDPADAAPHVGAEAVRAFFGGTHQMGERLTLTLTGLIRCCGNFAAFPMTAQAIIGDFRSEIDIIDVMTFDSEGKILEMRAYWSAEDMRVLQ